MNISELYQLFKDSKGICTDTRKIEPGTIFFALKGDNFNGNEYAVKALEEGCSFAVVDEPIDSSDDRVLTFPSALKALQGLANFHRLQFDIPVLGITGSNGKTTTKELIGAALNKKYNVLMTEGNLNNFLGVPFTLLRLTHEHEFAVIEMGASIPGDIEELCQIAEPDCAIITNIGAAHIEGFGSLEGVIETKTALYRWIENNGGEIFYNVDDSVLVEQLPPDCKTISYGTDKGDIQFAISKMDPFVHIEWKEGSYTSPEIKSNLVGGYNSPNMAAAITIGRYFDVSAESINSAMEEYIPSNNRSQLEKTERNTLIIDCYNANPSSMSAALAGFIDIEHPKKLVILGDMLELGEISSEEHQQTINEVIENLDHYYFVGAEFSKSNGPAQNIFLTWQELSEQVDLSVLDGYLILLKGSRGIRLENLVPLL